MILNPIDAHPETSAFLLFEMDGETFALEASRVREVLKSSNIAKVPRMPAHLPGIVNVRGDVVAVVDFGLFLKTSTPQCGYKGWLVIADALLNDEPMRVGILANAVQDVVHLAPDDIAPPPEIGVNIDADFIRGVSRQEDAFLLIVDADKVLAAVHRTIDPENRAS
jgi:purine-binding chemotaxis protein CheW